MGVGRMIRGNDINYAVRQTSLERFSIFNGAQWGIGLGYVSAPIFKIFIQQQVVRCGFAGNPCKTSFFGLLNNFKGTLQADMRDMQPSLCLLGTFNLADDKVSFMGKRFAGKMRRIAVYFCLVERNLRIFAVGTYDKIVP